MTMDDLEPGNVAMKQSPLHFASPAIQVSGEQMYNNLPAGLRTTGVLVLPWSYMSCHNTWIPW